MPWTGWSVPPASMLLALAFLLQATGRSEAEPGNCLAERPDVIATSDPALCAGLEAVLRAPSALPLDAYQAKLDLYLGNYCHRNASACWRRDKVVRDTGPFTATLNAGKWQGNDYGTHGAVVIWYSPEMASWLTANRPGEGTGPDDPPPVPDGAVMVKEMFPPPADACAGIDPEKLFPSSGAAIMVRDRAASQDGWFWGWYGFGKASGWAPDWPPAPSNPYPNQGFGQYCMNCHASAANNLTFASAKNMAGEPGEPLVFLSQNFFAAPAPEARHATVALPSDDVRRLGEPHYRPDTDVLEALRAYVGDLPSWDTVSRMPSQTYDNTWVAAEGPTAADEFVTSSQCIGCHDAGSTWLQFDMTKPNPHGDGLINLSPYAGWRTSPMGLAGRDPFFFAQLASETESFHPQSTGLVENTCLGCHGVLGQRQFHIDGFAETGECRDFSRAMVDAVPWPAGTAGAGEAGYAMLARDGISCTSCHRMALGAETAAAENTPENACVVERQALLNPDNSGFARTFTGSFFVRPPDSLISPQYWERRCRSRPFC